jgi:hypothetical protein
MTTRERAARITPAFVRRSTLRVNLRGVFPMQDRVS